MRNPLRLNVPPGAAATIVALALVAGVVTGRERGAEPERTPVEAPSIAQPAAPPEDLDLAKLLRQREKRSIPDLFATRAPAPVVVPFVPPPPPEPVRAEPPPSAPPLPFRYLGRMTRGDKTVVYLLRGEEVLVAEVGAALLNLYRVEAVSDFAVHFVYIPLGEKQVLALAAGN